MKYMITDKQNIVSKDREFAILGGGCFWCLEAIFNELKGVEKVESGYSGGNVTNPAYKEVCSGKTGHAEVIKITFDPRIISFSEILSIFFTIHDPTTLDRQGNDIGNQYRSVILYSNSEQKTIAEKVVKEIEAAKIWQAPIVTQIEPLKEFYKAEDYHQRYFEQNPNQLYCRVIIDPKIIKFRRQYQNLLKKLE